MTADNQLPSGQARAGNLATLIGAAVAAAMAALTNLVVNLRAATSGGASYFHLQAAAGNNATVVKASAGQLYGWSLVNISTDPYKVCFHNASSSPTAEASIAFVLVVPAQGTVELGAGSNGMTDVGVAFSTGIAITTVKVSAAADMADTATTSAAANELSINLFYK